MNGKQTTATSDELRYKIDAKNATVGIVGMGYVGLPLAVAVFNTGFNVIGFDVDPHKISCLESGDPYLSHFGDHFLKTLADSTRFVATSSPTDLKNADIIILCVPTPLDLNKEPDLSYVLNSTKEIAKILRRGQMVILESTTYPGTTRDEVLPLLERGAFHREWFPDT
ncbi:MAG: NAD(P)-binding domain-containing protein [Planctomycetota bacterium]|nr:NAD(P)-binding domain-containing protein [Planctomycetota bacterium]